MIYIRIASNTFVAVPSELLEKAARAFTKHLTADHVSKLVASEPHFATGALIGLSKLPDAGKDLPLAASGKVIK